MLELLNKYDLSIRFSADGFSLLINETGNKISSRRISCSIFSQSKDEIIDTLSEVQELNTAYATTRLICESDTYAVIPSEIFEENIAADLLRAQHPEFKTDDEIAWNRLLAWNAVIVFAVPKTLFAVLNGSFPEIEIEHHIFAFVNDFVELQNSTAVFIEDRNSKLDAVVIRQGNLQLINTFPYTAKEDFLYQILNIYTVLDLDIEHCPLKIHFEKPKAEILELLKKYLKECE
ncbi:MAG: DUF3822 family protein [Paludibacter sp.]|jgi:hypothetical protein|nr:DUF3822 family protein [Paludibacter sp.]